MSYTENYEEVFGPLKEGILICDEESKIKYFNQSYGYFIKKELKEVKNKYLREVRPGARAPEVITNGKPLIGLVRREKEEEEYFTNIYPTYVDNKITGSISIVTFLKDAVYLTDKIKKLEKTSEYLNRRIRENNGTRYNFNHIIGKSAASKNTIHMAKRLAVENVNILISGESGTGKELYAQSVHNESPRRYKPFVAVNCSTLSQNMLEAEMFGYEEGTFTGALKGGKIGLFQSAEGGSIFLDEVSEMEISLQAKLLRVLQEMTIRRIGGNKEIPVDVRIISACNVDLKRYVEEGRFREDLYYRISTFPLHLAPLRDRKEDIPLLVDYFLNRINIRLKKNLIISPEVMRALLDNPWKGNIRELKNVLEFAAIMTKEEIIDIIDLPVQISEKNRDALETNKKLSERVKDFEKSEIRSLLDLYGDTLEGKKTVAKILGISLSSLYNKI